MDAVGLEAFHGKPLKILLDAVAAARQAGGQQLSHAEQLLEVAVAQDLDSFALGKLRQQLWEVQRQLGRHPVYFSEAGQDRYVHEQCFPGRRNGTFLDIGAFDGVRSSNTCFFEKFLGWTGTLVEPVPRLAAAAREARSAAVIEAAVADRTGRAEFVDVTSGYQMMGGLSEHYPAPSLGHVRANPHHAETLIDVAVVTLNQLLAELGYERIDFCSIDVEGAERALAAAWDADRVPIDVLAVENSRQRPETGVRDLLEPRGYVLLDVIGVDEIYRRQSAPRA